MNKVDNDAAWPPIAVVGGTQAQRQEFAQLFKEPEQLDLIDFPTGLASRLTTARLPKIVVFLHPYSTVMLAQAAEKRALCLVYAPYLPNVEYGELESVLRAFIGPEDCGPFLTKQTFAKEVSDIFRCI